MGRIKAMTLDLGGAGLDCVRFGAGHRQLVMLPGLSLQGVRGAALPLAYMYRAFARDYTVYILDKRDKVPEGLRSGTWPLTPSRLWSFWAWAARMYGGYPRAA